MTESEQLTSYLKNAFLPGAEEPLSQLPLPEESHVRSWRNWHECGNVEFNILAQQLPQLFFGVENGISKSAAYHKAVLGGDFTNLPSNTDLPEGNIEFSIKSHWAGSLPTLSTRSRGDFEWLFRVLGYKGENVAISPNVHALLITGLPNPGRLVATREAWDRGELADDPLLVGCRQWNEAMKTLDTRDKTRFRDRILLIHHEPYANLEPEDVQPGLTATEWLAMSAVLRQEHEFAHYATRRMFNGMRLNLHDELIADCMGFTEACGRFDAKVFLLGLGIEHGKLPETAARVWTYVQDLSDEEVILVGDLAISAAMNVEAWLKSDDLPQRPKILRAMASMSLLEIAEKNAATVLQTRVKR